MTRDPNSTAPSLLLPGEAFSALIFDCDGTLVDTAPSHLFAYNRALGELGMEMTSDFYRPRFGLSPQSLLAQFAAERGADFDSERLVGRYAEHFQADLSRLSEIPLVADLARAHRGKTPMAVASNGTRANVERTLDTVGLRGLFDVLVAIDDVAQGKPAPDLYLEAARRLEVDPLHCIVFEDTDEGLEAARAAGMRARDIRLCVSTAWVTQADVV